MPGAPGKEVIVTITGGLAFFGRVYRQVVASYPKTPLLSHPRLLLGCQLLVAKLPPRDLPFFHLSQAGKP